MSVAQRRSRLSHRPKPRWLALAVLALLVPSGATAAAHPAAAPGPSAPVATQAGPAGGTPPAQSLSAKIRQVADQPSIQYLEAMAHADDPNTFTAGGRVTRGFTPRPSDAWPVDGGSPRALPAGRETGAQMATGGESGTDANSPSMAVPSQSEGPSAPVDAPANAGPATPAQGTSAALPVDSGTVDPAASPGLRRQVFGFLPSWELGQSSTVLDYDLLSTVAYFGVGSDSSGNLIKKNSDGTTSTGWGGWTSAAMTTVISNAHAAGTRVVLTIELFAWTTSQANNQATFLASPAARLNLAQQAAAAVRDRGADGVNVDFEPIVSGYSSQFVAFIRTLRSQLDAISTGYQLTVDTTGHPGNYDLPNLTATGAADALFIMGYDYRTAGASRAGSISPLYSPVTYDLTDTLNTYLAKVPASKVILGLPYYGRAWSTTSNGPNATTTTSCSSATPTYDQAASLAAANGRHYDAVESSAWTAYTLSGCSGWRELYYDDAQSLGAKYDFINEENLRGSGIWALGYDGTRPELWQTLAAKFLNDTTPPVAGIEALAPVQTNEGFTVQWTGRDDWSGVKSYDVQVSVDGGPWSAWAMATTATSAIYLGQTGHGYAFRVRATDGSGNVGPWDVTQTYSASPSFGPGGFATVVAPLVNLRSTPVVTSDNVFTTAAQGTILQVTGGPTVSGGLTWYQVTAPITEWGPVGPVDEALWVAVQDGTGTTLVTARQAPNATGVAAGIAGLSFAGAGSASLGPNGSELRFLAPGGTSRRTLEIDWTDGVAFGGLTLLVLTTTGTPVGSISLGARGPGSQSYVWDGSVGGTALAGGTYLLQLTGSAGGITYAAPSANPATPDQVARYAVTLDRASGATYVPLTSPGRLFDTRQSSPLASGVPRTFQVSGFVGVPSGALAITGNLTVTGETYPGYVALTTGATATPTTSTINFPTGDTRANGVTVPLAPDGSLAAVYITGRAGDRANLILDVTGYFR